MTHELSPAQVAAVVAQNRELKAENEALKGRMASGTQSPAYGLSDTVLERAAEAHYDHYLRGFATKPDDPAIPTWRTRGPSPDAKRMFVESMRAALPVLGVAIERALIERMIADSKDCPWVAHGYNRATRKWDSVLETWLTRYLPAAEEREQEGAR